MIFGTNHAENDQWLWMITLHTCDITHMNTSTTVHGEPCCLHSDSSLEHGHPFSNIGFARNVDKMLITVTMGTPLYLDYKTSYVMYWTYHIMNHTYHVHAQGASRLKKLRETLPNHQISRCFGRCLLDKIFHHVSPPVIHPQLLQDTRSNTSSGHCNASAARVAPSAARWMRLATRGSSSWSDRRIGLDVEHHLIHIGWEEGYEWLLKNEMLMDVVVLLS